MENNQSNGQRIELNNELEFLRNLIDSLPALVYVNELESPGDPLSIKNVYLNQYGLDMTGYTRVEINNLGYGFFEEIIHPDDLEVIPITIDASNNNRTIASFISMQRLRFKGQKDYRWFYDHGTTISTFKDGSPRQALVVAVEVTDTIITHKQLHTALKEIDQLKYALKLSKLTKREKEVLQMISKGKTDKVISEKLFISLKTAKKHRSNLIKKTEVNNTAELVALAVEAGVN